MAIVSCPSMAARIAGLKQQRAAEQPQNDKQYLFANGSDKPGRYERTNELTATVSQIVIVGGHIFDY